MKKNIEQSKICLKKKDYTIFFMCKMCELFDEISKLI